MVDSSASRACLLGLPKDVLLVILACLDKADVSSLSKVSRFCGALCREATPGLKLLVYPHQVGQAWSLSPLVMVTDCCSLNEQGRAPLTKTSVWSDTTSAR